MERRGQGGPADGMGRAVALEADMGRGVAAGAGVRATVAGLHARTGESLSRRATGLARVALAGGLLLAVAAALVDLGWLLGRPGLEALGNALSALAGLGLIWLPFGLLAAHPAAGRLARLGSGGILLGTVIVSLVDVPAAINPADLGAGGAFGPLGLLLLSAGYLLWFAALRRARARGWPAWLYLLAGLWFPLTFPLIQLPLFVLPHGRPLFILLAGALGLLQALLALTILAPTTDRVRPPA